MLPPLQYAGAEEEVTSFTVLAVRLTPGVGASVAKTIKKVSNMQLLLYLISMVHITFIYSEFLDRGDHFLLHIRG